jgi:hypothetical protein
MIAYFPKEDRLLERGQVFWGWSFYTFRAGTIVLAMLEKRPGYVSFYSSHLVVHAHPQPPV